jgi:hypothetical protein
MRYIPAAFGAGLLLGGLIVRSGGFAGGVPLCVFGALILVGTLGERFRYKKLDSTPPGLGWRPTGERFVDAESGDVVMVYYRERTGERRYVRAVP